MAQVSKRRNSTSSSIAASSVLARQRAVELPASGAVGEPTSSVQLRTAIVISTLGSQRALADLLNVSRSQPSRWQSGEESPSPEHSRELLDLDHVLARASLLWAPPVVLSWLNGANAFLEGAKPIDVLRVRGSVEVIQALDAEMAGAYA